MHQGAKQSGDKVGAGLKLTPTRSPFFLIVGAHIRHDLFNLALEAVEGSRAFGAVGADRVPGSL